VHPSKQLSSMQHRAVSIRPMPQYVRMPSVHCMPASIPTSAPDASSSNIASYVPCLSAEELLCTSYVRCPSPGISCTLCELSFRTRAGVKNKSVPSAVDEIIRPTSDLVDLLHPVRSCAVSPCSSALSFSGSVQKVHDGPHLAS
jgi:hypothetical protein